MTVYFQYDDDEPICDFIVESFPFKVGDKILLQVKNVDKDKWNVEELSQEVEVNIIEGFFYKLYGGTVTQGVSLTVTVSKI